MPPRTLKAPAGVWFSCFTQTFMPRRWRSKGQANCGVGGTKAPTVARAASTSSRVKFIAI